MPSPDPSGGQAPALHFPSPPLWIPACAGMTNGVRVDECGCGDIRALLRPRNIVFITRKKE